jgi:hypothetical protein
LSKNGVSVYLLPEKCQYLRSGCTDFRFKSRFGNVIKFYKKHLTTKYSSKIALNLTDAEETQTFENFVKDRSRKDFTETFLGHLRPSLILVFFDNFVRPKIASREPCTKVGILFL